MKKTAIVLSLFAACAAQAADIDSQRATRKADIEFYLTGYIGDDIALENAGCKKPEFPVRSESKRDIENVTRHYGAWRQCYNAFIDRLGKLTPLGSAIPADLRQLMTPAELELSRARLAKVYQVVAEDGELEAKQVIQAYDNWTAKTNEFVQLENARLKSKQREIDQMNRDFGEKMDMAPRKH